MRLPLQALGFTLRVELHTPQGVPGVDLMVVDAQIEDADGEVPAFGFAPIPYDDED